MAVGWCVVGLHSLDIKSDCLRLLLARAELWPVAPQHIGKHMPTVCVMCGLLMYRWGKEGAC